jgi:pimeloyl-ACP methyl ester carboxylesterase
VNESAKRVAVAGVADVAARGAQPRGIGSCPAWMQLVRFVLAIAFGFGCGTSPSGSRPSPAPSPSPSPAPPAASAASILLEPATVVAGNGDRVEFERGILRVAENRRSPGGRMIDVAFARLRGPAGATAPPIVFLAGGPGATYLDAFAATTGNGKRRLAMFRRYATVADVVVLDQRGFSPTGTPLVAPTPTPIPLDAPNTIATSAVQWRAYAHDLAAANPDRDLSGYDLVQLAADVDDLRIALGYRQIALLGTSFGSQSALAVMRLYPDIVARAVLSAVEPLDHNFDMPSDVLSAMQRIATEADRAPNLRPYLPTGGLMAAIDELLARFAAGPVTVEVPTDTGTVSIQLGLEDLQAVMAPLGEAEEWPAWILALYHGHYEAWAAAEIASRRGSPFIAAMNPLIDSSLGVSAARGRRLASDPAIRVLGRWGFAVHQATRDAWPSRDLGDDLRRFVTSPIPLVMVQGDWDTSTPIENARELAPHFTHHHLMVVHRGVHGMPSVLLFEDPAAFDAVLGFFRTGDFSALPTESTLAAVDFKTPDFPPPTRPRRR